MQRAPTPPASPSITALLVMIGFKIGLEHGYSDLFDKDELTLVNHMINTAIAAEPDYKKWALERFFVSLPYFAQQGFLNRGISPAFDAHKVARKLMIKNKTEKDIQENNVEQVIFLSGGYDHRSFLLSRKYPNAQFFELDRGDTRKIKIDALMKIPTILGADVFIATDSPAHVQIDNLHLIECDFLQDDLRTKLQACGFSPEKKTLFIAEGLTMYLSPAHNQELIERLFHTLHEGEEVLISYRSMMSNPLAITNRMHAVSNEMFQFALSPADAPAFASTKGFDLTHKMLCSDLLNWIHCQTSYMSPQSSIPRGDNYYLFRRQSATLDQQIKLPAPIDSIPLIVDAVIADHQYESRGCTLL